MILGWDSAGHLGIAVGVALVAGAVNAIAGGGTNISFPMLVWLGIPPVAANATNAVALWPGSLGGAWGFRREIARSDRRWLWLLVPSLVGGALGAWLLVHAANGVFRALAPWLVIGSSVLIALEPQITKRLAGQKGVHRSAAWLIGAGLAQLVIATYGGFFGAGLGILILTATGLLGLQDIHEANGLKNLYTLGIKGVAVAYFIVQALVVWRAAIPMAVAAVVGGYVGAALGRRVSEQRMRIVVVVIGVGMGVAMLVRAV